MKTIHYFSKWLATQAKYAKAWQQIKDALETENEHYEFIPNANDIWARDFMPFQRHDGEFVVYTYNPDYLQGKYQKYITNCRDAFLAIGGGDALNSSFCNHTNLVIDGGNIIKCKDKFGVDCVIMTTKVLYENPNLSHHEILMKLDDIFDAETILIPWDGAEMFGHADGMVRYLGNGTLLLNCYGDFDPALDEQLKKALGSRFELRQLSYGKLHRENSWCHLNYLELSKAILVPVASIASDKAAVQQISEYTGKKVIPISMAPIVRDGGAMHCISWTLDAAPLLEHNIRLAHDLFEPNYD